MLNTLLRRAMRMSKSGPNQLATVGLAQHVSLTSSFNMSADI
jgi:hypothetical protein